MYQIHKLLKYPGLFHAFSEKKDGNMANAILGKITDFKKVTVHRKRFLSSLGVPLESCVCMWVLGQDGIKEANPKNAGESLLDYKKAVKIDALITDKKGLYLFLLTADCAPVIIFDPMKPAVGLVHVGWKGADLEIVIKAIKKMHTKYNSNPRDLIIGIGPAARKNSFIKENPSQLNDQRWQSFLKKTENARYSVDFVGFCNKQLTNAGVLKQNIHDCGIDTVSDKRFFSHVREGNLPLSEQGRFACVVGLNN